LRKHELGVSADSIWHIHNSVISRSRPWWRDGSVTSVVVAFPEFACEVYRHALAKPEIQRGYFPHFHSWSLVEVLQFGLQVLGQYGEIGDLALLKMYAEDAKLGSAAVSAIHKIRDRT